MAAAYSSHAGEVQGRGYKLAINTLSGSDYWHWLSACIRLNTGRGAGVKHGTVQSYVRRKWAMSWDFFRIWIRKMGNLEASYEEVWHNFHLKHHTHLTFLFVLLITTIKFSNKFYTRIMKNLKVKCIVFKLNLIQWGEHNYRGSNLRLTPIKFLKICWWQHKNAINLAIQRTQRVIHSLQMRLTFVLWFWFSLFLSVSNLN